MLSSENPPPDPSCSSQFPQLNSNSDEKASASDHRPPQELHNHPSFSIRDYVFKARSKDIKKNWPFSLKNLQLCLKHGVKELLPPLQPLKKCLVETSSIQKEKTSNHAASDEKSDNPQLNHKLAESCFDISLCRSGDENDFPSTTTSVSHSEIESLAGNRLSTSQTEIFRKTSAAAAESAEPSGINKNKTENTCKPLSKKCRLIVKFGGNSDRSSTEDIASTSTTVSETMGSKVCPVCKTFSSSSNTTLNAHIDQCLSVESTPKWTSDSKLTRHRVKPRKTRLMVDVYSTALPCTLEELDRRNGTSWAAISCLPTQETETEMTGNAETINEGKKMRVSQVHPEDIGDVGPVYIDANGTKLRILSKFDDQPSVSKVREDIEARKPHKGDKGGKYISNKKKLLALKYHKFLKVAPESKMNFSHLAHGSKMVEEECEGEAEGCEKEHTVSNQTKPSDSVTLRPWVCSKRRGFANKTSQLGRQPVRCNWHLPGDLPDRNVTEKYTNLSENFMSFSAKNDKKEKSFRTVQVSKKREQFPGRKRMGNLLVAARSSVDSGLLPVKPTSIQFGNHGTSKSESGTTRHPDCTWKDSSLLRKRTFDACGAANDSGTWIARKKSSRDANGIPGKRMQFSSLRKDILRVNGRSTMTESVLGKVKKLSALKKSQLRFMKKRNEEGVSLKDRNAENQDEREKTADEMNTVLEPGQGSALAMRTSHPLSHLYNDNVPGDDFLHKADCLDSAGNQGHTYVDDIVDQPSSNTCEERITVGTFKSIDSEIYELSKSLNAQPDCSLQSAEDYRRLLCGTEAPPAAPTEVDYEHSFPEVDPIPIPGPPGSFLPSPRDMGSDDFQGNSSLTTSRVHSSLDQHDVVDGDSSDSPMSAASTISNSRADRRCNFKYSEPSSLVDYSYERMRCGVQSSLQSVDTVAQESSAEVERTAFDGGYDRIYMDKNDQPCCCQRKERLSQAVALNFQESPLLRRRNLASMTIPTGGKQTANLDARSELALPSSCPYPRSGKMLLPVTKPPARTVSFRDSPNVAGMKRADCGSASPSSSNPVLRLMGKNLLVVNKEDDGSSVGAHPHIQTTPRTSQLLAFSKVNTRNHDTHPVNQLGSQAPVIFGQSSCRPVVGEYYECGLSNNVRIRPDSRLPVPAGTFQNQHSFAAQNPVKEIIIIDDGPESENVVMDNIPTASKYSPDFVQPFCCYQSQELVVESVKGHSANYHTTPSKLANNTSSARWGWTSEGSGVAQRSPFTAASTSPSHITSTTGLHYPPGFS